MQENPYMEEIGFDPFCQKHEGQGLSLEGVKVESVEEFELTYDSKLTFNLKYEALIGAMEYIREHSWVIGWYLQIIETKRETLWGKKDDFNWFRKYDYVMNGW